MAERYQEPVFVTPCFESRIWGGRKLETAFGFDLPAGNIGEAWAVSAYPGRESLVRGGSFDGMPLSVFWREHPGFFGKKDREPGAPSDAYPFITKIIDAKDNLSIQVHPDDAYAAQYENGQKGKTECWYILDAPEGASLIIGHNARSRGEFCAMIDEGHWDALLRHVPVKPGDFIQIEPGTIHAITAGVMLLETQQSSDLTYRLYDYGRLENGRPRELHLAQSKAVCTVPSPSGEEMVEHMQDAPVNRLTLMECCRFYAVYLLPVKGEAALNPGAGYAVATVTEGEGSLKTAGREYPLKKGDSFLLPGELTADARVAGNCRLVIATE